MNNEEIKAALARLYYCKIDFIVIQSGKKSSKVNGLYKPATREIILHNKNFTTDNQLMYTAIHELTHHILTTEKGVKTSKSHSGIFWATFYDLIDKAIELKLYTRERSDQTAALVAEAVEIQKKIFENLSNNIEMNHLENKIIAVNKDIKNIEGKYSYIISNPPYRKINSGRLPEDESERISKYEITLTLEELFVQIRRLLKNCGEFFVIVPDERLNDSFSYIYKNNMNILEMEVNRYKKRNLIILRGKKGGKANSGINIEIS